MKKQIALKGKVVTEKETDRGFIVSSHEGILCLCTYFKQLLMYVSVLYRNFRCNL